MSKFALVTGASGEIGRSISQRLATDGWSVLVHFHSDAAGAEETLRLVKPISPHSRTVQFDIAKSTEVEATVKDLEVQALINNAGLHLDNMAVLMNNESFERVIQTNLVGPFYLTKAVAKKMLLDRKGVIVNVSSLSGQVGNVGQVNYSAAKAGLIAMTKTLAKEFGPRGIRVNTVAPGLIETEMVASIPHLSELVKQIPLGRMGKPEEVASVVSFLCSADASYVHGHTLSINGGLFPN